MESKRGSESRKAAAPATRDIQARKPAGAERIQRPQAERPRQSATERKPQTAQRQAQMPKQAGRSQAAGRELTQQQRDIQRRSEAAKPNAFEGSRNARATQVSSQRGAVSQQRSANAGNIRAQGARRPTGGGGARAASQVRGRALRRRQAFRWWKSARWRRRWECTRGVAMGGGGGGRRR